MAWQNRKDVTCPVEATLSLISGRWKVMILYHLFRDTERFNSLQRKLKGITPRTLTQQLRELEADGLIVRRVYAEIPPKVEYSLTPLGLSLRSVLGALHRWGQEYGPTPKSS